METLTPRRVGRPKCQNPRITIGARVEASLLAQARELANRAGYKGDTGLVNAAIRLIVKTLTDSNEKSESFS